MNSEKSCRNATGSCHGPTAREVEAAGWFGKGSGIVVTINPEARVSAIRVGPSPRFATGDGRVRIPIQVINKGLVTAQLQAVLLEPHNDLVEVSLPGLPLSGAPDERRELELRAIGPGPLDVTISFQISPEGGELAGRDKVHFLLKADSLHARNSFSRY